MSVATNTSTNHQLKSHRNNFLTAFAAVALAALIAAGGFVAGKSSGVSRNQVEALIAQSENHQASALALQKKAFHSILIERQNASYLKGRLLALQSVRSLTAAPSVYGIDDGSSAVDQGAAAPVVGVNKAANCKTPAECQEASKKIPSQFTTPGAPPPVDGKAPAGGATGQTFN